ncbi:MAG: prolyl oligopeptidase family serine peptidase [Clostridia bacterium]|nr:prolyl oligopeptidase family serine peptidase [Clostridia bacterium]
MKKTIIILSVIMCLICLPVIAGAQGVTVTANAIMGTPYHQLNALFIEYPENVAAASIDDYMVVDFQTFNFLEIYERRPYQQGVITSVYTNDAPAIREDRQSVPGRYVVIELETVTGSYYDEEAEMWRPNNIAGIATVRTNGETTDHYRLDWSLFTVIQRNDILGESGEVINSQGVLPTIAPDGVETPEMATFTQQALKSQNGLYDIYYNISLPENYDANEKYPIIFCQPGAGGSLDYNKQTADGQFIDIGGNSTRDMLPISMARLDGFIVVTTQPWNNTPAEWEVDNPGDYIYLVEYIRDNYAVDADRIYAIGNSKGTMMTSQAIYRRPDLFTAYAQCNGCFNYIEDGESKFFSIFKDELTVPYKGYTEEEMLALAADPENRLDAETIAQRGQYLDGIVENEMPVYCFDGVNTEVLSPLCTASTYIYLKECYEAKGYSQERIDELVRLDFAEDEQFLKYGVCEYHESTKIVAMDEFDVIPWLLSR